MIYNLIKRFFDIVFSFIVLVILSPFFASVSLLLLFTGENEILYFQERIGHKNKKFKKVFNTEKDIFDYFKYEYVEPHLR